MERSSVCRSIVVISWWRTDRPNKRTPILCQSESSVSQRATCGLPARPAESMADEAMLNSTTPEKPDRIL